MSIEHWGEFEEIENSPEPDKTLSAEARRFKLAEVEACSVFQNTKTQALKIKNPLITQTIEVTKQTEMLRSLIDTYSMCSGTSNYLLNPSQMIPAIDFPPENSADFLKPLELKRTIFNVCVPETPLQRGEPQNYPILNSNICRAVLRKAIVGHLCVGQFELATESSLVLFADVVDHFIRTFLDEIHQNRTHQTNAERSPTVTASDFEKAAHTMLGKSILQMPHNFFRKLKDRNIRARNDYKLARADYDKLVKESYQEQNVKLKIEDDQYSYMLNTAQRDNDNVDEMNVDFFQNFNDASGSVASSTSTSRYVLTNE